MALGNLLLSNGEYDLALQDFSAIIDAGQQYDIVFYNRGLSLFFLGQFERAMQDFSRAIELNDQETDYYVYKALSLLSIGQVEESFKIFEVALELDPNNPDTYYKRSTAFFEVEDFFKRANFLYDIQNYVGAMDDLNYAIMLDETVPAPYTNRGLLKFEMKDKSGACADWKKAFQLGSLQAQQLLQKHCR